MVLKISFSPDVAVINAITLAKLSFLREGIIVVASRNDPYAIEIHGNQTTILWFLRNFWISSPEELSKYIPEACEGCGCLPGEGITEGCSHPEGCGYNR